MKFMVKNYEYKLSIDMEAKLDQKLRLKIEFCKFVNNDGFLN